MVQKVITPTPTSAIANSNSCRTDRGREKKEELWLVGGVKGVWLIILGLGMGCGVIFEDT